MPAFTFHSGPPCLYLLFSAKQEQAIARATSGILCDGQPMPRRQHEGATYTERCIVFEGEPVTGSGLFDDYKIIACLSGDEHPDVLRGAQILRAQRTHSYPSHHSRIILCSIMPSDNHLNCAIFFDQNVDMPCLLQPAASSRGYQACLWVAKAGTETHLIVQGEISEPDRQRALDLLGYPERFA